jgi:aminoglycoside phosphotransferase (APT) family kinase protein
LKELSFDTLFSLVKELKETLSVKKIEKGYSYDLKYKVTYEDGSRLLRIHDLKQKEQVLTQLNRMNALYKMGVKCPKVYAFQEVNEHNICYSITEWLDGEDGETAIPQLDAHTQYQVGYEAGCNLRIIHSLKIEEPIITSKENTEKSKMEFERCVRRYKELNINLPFETNIIEYVYEHYDLLDDRPIVFTHGDFHANNIIVKGGKYAGVIDFERCKLDCPYSDFNKIELFSSALSKEFAKGVVDGYFQENIPDDFWVIRSFYMARNMIFHMVWATDNFPGEFEHALQTVNRVINEYEYFTLKVPKWYSSK